MARSGRFLARCLVACATFALGGCLSDAVGVGELTLVVEGATADSAWVGLPGADTLVRVRVYDLEGNPVAGAQVAWSPRGTGANLSTDMVRTDRQGYAVARWRIGTDAAERQELHIAARWRGAQHEAVLHGRLEPAVVGTLRYRGEVPLIVRLGDTVRLDVVAVDPFGNEFPAPSFGLTIADSGIGAVLDSTRVTGLRRGRSALRLASGLASTDFPLEVVQRVSAIEVSLDTLQFTSLRAELPVLYVVRDDRGAVISDTAPMLVVGDTTIARRVGDRVRADAPGTTELQLTLGDVVTRLPVAVRQLIYSLRLIRDTVRFDALSDTTTLRPLAFDSLGSEIRDPQLEYAASDGSVARVGGPIIEAVGSGTALVTARDPVTGLEASLEIVVRQRVATIDMPAVPLMFDALGDSALVVATPRDRLGATVHDVVLEYVVADTTLAVVDSGTNRVRALAEGSTVVTVGDAESGVTATRNLRIEQVAATLSVEVGVGGAVITLPAGAALPLQCAAADRNGYAMTQVPALVRTVRGTVTSAACADVRVQRSGYDTLVFALGSVETRVPVIVSTRPDSVAVQFAAQPLTSDWGTRFEGEDFANPLVLALRPLIAEIIQAYGNPTSTLDRARALRDWVARTAIHPDLTLHPDGSTANRSVLPLDKTWADVNALHAFPGKVAEDNQYWHAAQYDGYVMLDRLLGTLDPLTGLRAGDGMMERVAAGQYRVRDITTYRYLQCSWQSMILSTLWAADGLHGFRIAIEGHDPAAVFIPELRGWIYEDPTFNEEYLLDGVGQPLSALELLELSTAGQAGRFHAAKMVGPSFDPEPYIAGHRYLDAGHPDGMRILGGQLLARVVGREAIWGPRYVQIDVPALVSVPAPWSDESIYQRVTPDVAFPTLAPVVAGLRIEDSVQVVSLNSTYPNHQHYERRLPGQAWEAVDAEDVLPVGACRVEYRSVDAVGSVSAAAVLDVWAPRAEAFIQTAATGSTRAQAPYCVSLPIQ